MRNSRIEKDFIECAAVSSAAQEPDNDPGRTQSFGEKRWGRERAHILLPSRSSRHVLKIRHELCHPSEKYLD